jgi:hypothetical protein
MKVVKGTEGLRGKKKRPEKNTLIQSEERKTRGITIVQRRPEEAV